MKTALPAEVPRPASRSLGFHPERVTPAGSVLLDVIRFAAAFAVAFGHLCSPQFSYGWFDRGASWDGVAVFFVLSGFVIRLVTTTRPMSQYEFFVDRASRMYSVVVPALLLNAVVGIVWKVAQPRSPYLLYIPFGSFLVDVIANLTYSTQFWGLNVSNPLNPVFWSLSYECSYYAIYGAFFFRKTSRAWLGIAGLALLVGPPILLLLPVWLAGMAAHDVYQRLRKMRGALLGYTAFIGVIGALLYIYGDPFQALQQSTQATLRGTFLRDVYTAGKQHHFHFVQRANIYFYIVGIPTALLLVWLLLLVDSIPLRRSSKLVAAVRRIADGTFALYLMHYAFLMLILVTIPYDKTNPVAKLTILLSVTLVCILIAIPCDWLKDWIRKTLHVRTPLLTAAIKPAADL